MPTTTRPRVLLATCAQLPTGDPDEAGLPDALAEAGLDPRWAVWDDVPAAETAGATVVLRSTWDYTPRRDEFLRWVGATPDIHNGPDLVTWNSDKRYLLDLAAAGLPVTPTRVLEPGAPAVLPADGPFVLKPSVGAGSRGAGRFARADDPRALAHLHGLHAAGRTVLVQPYLSAVDTHGETAVVLVDGEVSHAVRKGPMLADGDAHPVTGEDLFVAEQIAPRTPDERELALARTACALVTRRTGSVPLYLRVDLLPGPDGPVVVELEAVEPSLFFTVAPDPGRALRRLAEAVAARAGG